MAMVILVLDTLFQAHQHIRRSDLQAKQQQTPGQVFWMLLKQALKRDLILKLVLTDGGIIQCCLLILQMTKPSGILPNIQMEDGAGAHKSLHLVLFRKWLLLRLLIFQVTR